MTHTFSSIPLHSKTRNQGIWSMLPFGNWVLATVTHPGSVVCVLSWQREAVSINEWAQEFTSTSLKSLRGKLQCSSLQTQSAIKRRFANKSFAADSTILALHRHRVEKMHYAVRPDREKWVRIRQSFTCWTKSSDPMQWWAHDFYLFLFLQETQSPGPQLLLVPSETCPSVLSPTVPFHMIVWIVHASEGH